MNISLPGPRFLDLGFFIVLVIGSSSVAAEETRCFCTSVTANHQAVDKVLILNAEGHATTTDLGGLFKIPKADRYLVHLPAYKTQILREITSIQTISLDTMKIDYGYHKRVLVQDPVVNVELGFKQHPKDLCVYVAGYDSILYPVQSDSGRIKPLRFRFKVPEQVFTDSTMVIWMSKPGGYRPIIVNITKDPRLENQDIPYSIENLKFCKAWLASLTTYFGIAHSFRNPRPSFTSDVRPSRYQNFDGALSIFGRADINHLFFSQLQLQLIASQFLNNGVGVGLTAMPHLRLHGGDGLAINLFSAVSCSFRGKGNENSYNGHRSFSTGVQLGVGQATSSILNGAVVFRIDYIWDAEVPYLKPRAPGAQKALSGFRTGIIINSWLPDQLQLRVDILHNSGYELYGTIAVSYQLSNSDFRCH